MIREGGEVMFDLTQAGGGVYDERFPEEVGL